MWREGCSSSYSNFHILLAHVQQFLSNGFSYSDCRMPGMNNLWKLFYRLHFKLVFYLLAGYNPLILFDPSCQNKSIFCPTVDVMLMMCPMFFLSSGRLDISFVASRITWHSPMMFDSIISRKASVLSSFKIRPFVIVLTLLISKSIP